MGRPENGGHNSKKIFDLIHNFAHNSLCASSMLDMTTLISDTVKIKVNISMRYFNLVHLCVK